MASWLAMGVLGSVAVFACSGPSGTADVRGIWNTQSIGEFAVPGTVVYLGDSLDTQYARWAFYDGARCTLTQFVDGLTNTFDECDYTMDGAQATITIFFQKELWGGSVEGNRLTLTDPRDVVWLLQAQQRP